MAAGKGYFDGGNRPLRVSDVTDLVKTSLEEAVPHCWVVGEVSDFTHHSSSGHRYFTLVDADSQLSCVMFNWYGRGVRFVPEKGKEVMAYGRVSVYERGGRYQFYATRLRPAGVGDLAVEFARLQERLEREGLFAVERKRPLPTYPRAVGVVTSSDGAAIRDIVHVLRRRAPGLRLILRPARVQGPEAAAEIATGIEDLNRHGGVDILIVGRGGGSPEDLWSFNEEVVARAIFSSELPVISAVGHEVDVTIADHAADYRAPTPSAAAEVVAQEQSSLLRRVTELRQRLRTEMQTRLRHHASMVESMNPARVCRLFDSRVQQKSQYVDERRSALAVALDWYLQTRTKSLYTSIARLEVLSPLRSLARGYAVCQRQDSGQVVTDGSQLRAGDRVKIRFSRGEARCQVEEVIDEQ